MASGQTDEGMDHASCPLKKGKRDNFIQLLSHITVRLPGMPRAFQLVCRPISIPQLLVRPHPIQLVALLSKRHWSKRRRMGTAGAHFIGYGLGSEWKEGRPTGGWTTYPNRTMERRS
jgi:hypothetical protein